MLLVAALCTVVGVVLPALEQLQQDLHLVGVLFEAAQQRVVPHHRLQHVRVRVVVEHVLLAEGADGQSLVQHLHTREKCQVRKSRLGRPQTGFRAWTAPSL